MSKHVLLTGASSGIGWSIGEFLGSKDVKVTLAARREGQLEELAEKMSCETFVRPTDVSDLENCNALFEDAKAKFGEVDILINNAGMQYVEPSEGISLERMDRLFFVNLLAPLRLQQLALIDMKARGAGTIVNVSSMAGITPTPGMMHYNASKAGLAAASESLRVELRNSGVNVLTVYPGPVRSPMESAARENYKETWAAKNAPMGEPEKLAKLIWNAVEKRKARVVYPAIYGLARYSRVSSQWVTDRFSPGFDE